MKIRSRVISILISITMVFTMGGGFSFAESGGEERPDIVTEDGVRIVNATSVEEASEATMAEDNEMCYEIDLEDGTVTTEDEEVVADGFSEIFGVKYSKAGLKGMSTDEKIDRIEEMTAESQLYSLVDADEDRAEIVSDYSSCRLIVDSTESIDTHGAEGGAYFKDSYILKYPDEETTAEAYLRLTEEYGSENVINDDIVKAAETSWGYDYMKFGSKKTQINNYGDEVLVAVLDTGIKASHAAFKGRTIRKGRSFVKGKSTASDDNGHGTAVSSVITECTGTKVQILPLKVLNKKGWGYNIDMVYAVEYARECNADVINMSIAGFLKPVKKANKKIAYYDKWFKAFEGPVVVAAGNNMCSVEKKYVWPAVSTQTITVSALYKDEDYVEFDDWYSNYGSRIDFSAPGTDIRAANHRTSGGYVYYNGTSFASPYVAAAAALIMSNDNTLTTKSQIYDKLKTIAQDLGTNGKDIYYGYGCPMLNKLMLKASYWPKSLRQATVTGVANQYYNGRYMVPTPVVKLNGMTLVDGTDYTVEYRNNRNVGIGSVVISGKGNYTRTHTAFFKILPKGTTLKKSKKKKRTITVKWKRQSARMSTARITGYQIQVATNRKFTKNRKTKKVKGYKKTSVKIKKVKAKKKYYVRIRTYKVLPGDRMGRVLYSKWSKIKTVRGR